MSVRGTLAALAAAATLALTAAAAGDPAPAPALPDEADAPIHRTNPVFPPEALLAGTNGAVVVDIDLDAAGVPVAVRVVESSPPGVFDRAVTDCVKQWRWAPKTVGGVAKPRTIRQKLEFRLAPG